MTSSSSSICFKVIDANKLSFTSKYFRFKVLYLYGMTSKDSHDPGWNDPPTFTYDKAAAIQAAAANKKGISLNKRVAFPISSSNSGNDKNKSASPLNVDSSKPPLMSPPPLTPSLPVVKSEQSHQQEVRIGSEERLEKVLENLQVETNPDEEIVKRIRIMEKMWKDGKLEESVQCRVYELSQALIKGDVEAADCIQMGLMVDYVSQCSSWMSGIRQLINQKKNCDKTEGDN